MSEEENDVASAGIRWDPGNEEEEEPSSSASAASTFDEEEFNAMVAAAKARIEAEGGNHESPIHTFDEEHDSKEPPVHFQESSSSEGSLGFPTNTKPAERSDIGSPWTLASEQNDSKRSQTSSPWETVEAIPPSPKQAKKPRLPPSLVDTHMKDVTTAGDNDSASSSIGSGSMVDVKEETFPDGVEPTQKEDVETAEKTAVDKTDPPTEDQDRPESPPVPLEAKSLDLLIFDSRSDLQAADTNEVAATDMVDPTAPVDLLDFEDPPLPLETKSSIESNPWLVSPDQSMTSVPSKDERETQRTTKDLAPPSPIKEESVEPVEHHIVEKDAPELLSQLPPVEETQPPPEQQPFDEQEPPAPEPPRFENQQVPPQQKRDAKEMHRENCTPKVSNKSHLGEQKPSNPFEQDVEQKKSPRVEKQQVPPQQERDHKEMQPENPTPKVTNQSHSVEQKRVNPFEQEVEQKKPPRVEKQHVPPQQERDHKEMEPEDCTPKVTNQSHLVEQKRVNPFEQEVEPKKPVNPHQGQDTTYLVVERVERANSYADSIEAMRSSVSAASSVSIDPKDTEDTEVIEPKLLAISESTTTDKDVASPKRSDPRDNLRYDTMDDEESHGSPLWRQDSPRRPTPKASLMAKTRSRAAVDMVTIETRTTASGLTAPQHALDEDEHAYILNTALAKKRNRVVQLLLLGLVGIALGFFGSFYVLSSCHFLTKTASVGSDAQDFDLHYGLWKYSPIGSAFDGYSYCTAYDEEYTGSIPYVSRAGGVAALVFGALALLVLWYYLVSGRAKLAYWKWSVRFLVLAGFMQLATFWLFADDVCRDNSCSLGPGAIVSIIITIGWFCMAFEMHTNTPVSALMQELNPDGPGVNMVANLEMTDFENGAKSYFGRFVGKTETHSLNQIQRMRGVTPRAVDLDVASSSRNGGDSSYRPPVFV